MALVNVGTVMAAYLVATTAAGLYLKTTLQPPSSSSDDTNSSTSSILDTAKSNPLIPTLLFFNNLNIFIAICEIALGKHINLIKSDYKKLKQKYGGGNEWDGCVAFLTMPLTIRQIFDLRTWSRMWSTYALCEYSCNVTWW